MAKKSTKTRKKAKEGGESTEVMVPEVMIDKELVERSVKWINKKVAETVEKGLTGLLEIGKHVFENFFHSNADEVRFRGRQKETSFRALATHDDLQISTTNLYNAVNLAIQDVMLVEAGVQTSEHITTSHKVEILRLSDLKDKKKLLTEATEKGYSVRQLRDRIDQVGGKKLLPAAAAEDGFKLPRPILALSALNLERLLSEKRLEKLNAKQLDSYRTSLEAAREKIGTMIRAIDKARK